MAADIGGRTNPVRIRTHVSDRLPQGLIAGIGFIGGGAIMKEGATVWNTGVIGAAVAMQRWNVAIALSALNVITVTILNTLKGKLDKEEPTR